MVEGFNLMSNDKPYICLLGATGFLGSAIAKELDSRGIAWIGTSRSENVTHNIKKVSLFDRLEMINLLKSSYLVINTLGSAKPKDFEEDPLNMLDILWNNTIDLTSMLNESGIEKLVHISSAGTVYGDYIDSPHSEKCELLPISWYGKAKVIEELYIEKSCLSNNIDYLCLRVTNPYGNDNKTQHGFIDVLLNSVLSNKEFYFYQDCNPIRDFIYAEDMAFSAIELIALECKGIYNLGNGEAHSLEDIATYVDNKLKGNTLIKRLSDRPSFDVLNNQVCIQKLINSKAHRSSMNVYKYIDNILDNIGK